MEKEIQEAIDRLPQDGRLDKMHEEIRRHLSTLVSTSGVGVGSNIDFGSNPAGDAVDAIMKSSANIPEDGSADNEVLVNDLSLTRLTGLHLRYWYCMYACMY